jgi:hypothetical protein
MLIAATAAAGVLLGAVVALTPDQRQPAPPLTPIQVGYGDRAP